jgi:hypothetical protein
MIECQMIECQIEMPALLRALISYIHGMLEFDRLVRRKSQKEGDRQLPLTNKSTTLAAPAKQRPRPANQNQRPKS